MLYYLLFSAYGNIVIIRSFLYFLYTMSSGEGCWDREYNKVVCHCGGAKKGSLISIYADNLDQQKSYDLVLLDGFFRKLLQTCPLEINNLESIYAFLLVFFQHQGQYNYHYNMFTFMTINLHLRSLSLSHTHTRIYVCLPTLFKGEGTIHGSCR